MLSRRHFLGTLLATIPSSSLLSAWSSWSKVYRIGISQSMIPSPPDDEIKESMSGIFEIPGKSRCQFEFGTADQVVQRLENLETHLSVLSGIEYAWFKATYPNLLPLVAVFNGGIRMKGCVVVRRDSQRKSLLELKGGTMMLPERLPQHSYIYLEHSIGKLGGVPKGFFAKSITTPDSNEGLESVIDNKADAILLDYEAWKGYQERKPARSKKLKMLHESIPFPSPVVVCHKENISKPEILLLKVALCNVHEKPFARQLFNFWGVNRFVPTGKEYQRVVDEMLSEIPSSITPSLMAATTVR